MGVLILAGGGAVLASGGWLTGWGLSARPAATPTAAATSDRTPTTRASAAAPTGSASRAAKPTATAATPTGQLNAVALPVSTEGGSRVVWYGLQIEEGLPVDAGEVAAVVSGALEDDRGWQTRDDLDFVPVAAGAAQAADFMVILASPGLTDRLCAPLRTNGRFSCGRDRRAVLNAWRWEHGAAAYGDNLGQYRTYLVNHEVGHLLGHPHRGCPGPGRPAPVMVQQTISLDGCAPNPWPS